jgi:hypothetical protein
MSLRMATYDKTKIPSTVPNRVESLLIFFATLLFRLAGASAVVEAVNGVPEFAVVQQVTRGTDGFLYLITRIRTRLNEDYNDAKKPIWESTPDTFTGDIPTNYGGV